jgi:hypothetical protein
MAWFWMGFTLDPALVVTEDSLATVSGDYFLALSQPWYQVHNAFIVAAIVTAKANARDYQNVAGVALPGHGRWASPRPFMAFKHSERELHHPPPNDLRFPIHARLWANAFRMFLYLMNDELERTNQVYDRKRTLDAVNYMHQWFGPGRPLEPAPTTATSTPSSLRSASGWRRRSRWASSRATRLGVQVVSAPAHPCAAMGTAGARANPAASRAPPRPPDSALQQVDLDLLHGPVVQAVKQRQHRGQQAEAHPGSGSS